MRRRIHGPSEKGLIGRYEEEDTCHMRRRIHGPSEKGLIGRSIILVGVRAVGNNYFVFLKSCIWGSVPWPSDLKTLDTDPLRHLTQFP